jgi:hypothetical protein
MQKGRESKDTSPARRIEGQIRLEGGDQDARNVRLKVFAFDRGGNSLGEAEVGAKGEVSLNVAAHTGEVEYVVSPAESAGDAKAEAVYSRIIREQDWKKQGTANVYNREIVLEEAIWRQIIRYRFCISGHVRKVSTVNG